MIYLKRFEANIVDEILDKISEFGIDSLTQIEKKYLDTYSKGKDTKEIQKEMSSIVYEDYIGAHKAKIILNNITPYNLDDTSHWNAKLHINDNVYDGYITFKDDEFVNGIFDSDDSDIYTDLEGLEDNIVDFLSWAFYNNYEKNIELI